MNFVYDTPDITAAEAKVTELQDRLDNKLGAQIETAIHAGDAKKVRALRDSRDDLACELHAAKVALAELVIAYAEEQDSAWSEEAKRLSDEAQVKHKEREVILAETEKIDQSATLAVQHRDRFRSRGYAAIQSLAESKQAETIRLRALARQA